MPTARPFAYYPGGSGGSNLIPGTSQIGNLAIGVTASGYNSGVGGVRWWNGPDESLGYVIAHEVPLGNQPFNPAIGATSAYVGFWRSSALTENSFVSLTNWVNLKSGGTGGFVTGTQSKTWLNTNGYWTSWGEPSPDGTILYLDAGNNNSYPGSGSTWFDISGMNNNGTINGAVYSSSSSGYFDFGGTSAYVATPLVTNTRTSVSIEAWFNSDNVNQAGQMIVFNGSDANVNGYGMSINTEGTTSGNLYVLYGGVSWLNTGVTLTSGTWYQAVMTISGTSLAVYLNGSQVYTATSTPNTPTLYTEIGRNDYPAARYFNGKISIIKMWNRPLSSSEVTSEWNEYKGRYILTSGLVVWLDSGDSSSYSGSGSTWFDLQGASNDATLINTPTYSSSYGGIIQFDDTSLEYATIPDIGDLNTWTVEVWFRLTSSISSKVSSLVSNQFNLSNKLNFSIGTNNAPNNYNIAAGFFDGAWRTTTGFSPSANTWYQVVGTYDGTTIRQYVNGVANGGTLSYSGTPQSGGEVRLMRRWDSSLTAGNLIDGDLSIVRIYSTALSSGEVLYNFNSEKSRFGL